MFPAIWKEFLAMQFDPIVVEGETWTFAHLSPFSFRYTIVTVGAELSLHVDVVFTCHCFSRKPIQGAPLPEAAWIYRTERETRILDKLRYQHSRDILPGVMKDLDARKILFASTENYMTIEATDARGVTGYYQVFFTVTRKEGVKRRLTLTVQSAYFVDHIHRRAKPVSRRPVRFKLIATAAYERRKLQVGR